MEDGVREATEEAGANLADLKKQFQEWQTATQDARTENLIDVDYYDGKQLTSGERLTLSKRGQPDIIINRVRPAVNGILGVVERGKSEPRAYPRTPGDEDSSDVATDVLRYVADENRFSALKTRAFKDMLVPGTLAAQVTVDQDLKVKIEQIRWEEFFYDPRSRREDFSDARFMGVARWMFADDVKAMYPDKGDDIEAAVNSGPMGSMLTADPAMQDRPQNGVVWVDRKRRRLLIVEQYYREGMGWERCVYMTSGILWEGASPYHDEKGRPTCPIEAQSAYVDRENARYGAVRDMRDVQDEINKRRSKALHYLNTRQIQEREVGSGMGSEEDARREAAKPDGVLPSGWEVVPQSDQVQGQLELLREAKAEIERLGPNPAILGREGADSSGRALLARQQSGLVEMAILFGGLEDWELRVHRQVWARVRQYWKAPQWIRVTDDDAAPKFVGINQPQMGPPQLSRDENGMPVLQPQVLGYKNAVAEMDVDIILDSTPDTANVQQEQFQDLIQMVGSNPAYAQEVPFEVLLQLSSIPHKKQLRDSIKAAREQAQQAQAAQQQMMQQVGQAKAAAEIRKTTADASLSEAKAQSEQLKPEMDALQMGIRFGAQDGPPPGFSGAREMGA